MRTPQLAFQVVGPAEGSGPATAAESAAPAEGQAPPPDAGFGSMFMILMFVPLLLFLFWQSRSQQKKQESAINALKKGDRVVTQSGLIGRLLEVDTRYAKLELAPGVKVQVLRTALVGRDGDDTSKSTAKGDTAKSDTSKSDSADSAKADRGAETEKKSNQ